MATRRRHQNVPTYRELLIPTLEALDQLGGSGTTREINSTAIRIARVPDNLAEVSHDGGSITEVEYQLAWSRTYLKNAGLIARSQRGVWRVSHTEKDIKSLDVAEVLRRARSGPRRETASEHEEAEPADFVDWKEALIRELISLKPDAFERIAQLVLRESGFTHVEVRGKTGDGGIDGVGVLKLNNVLSFHVYFQCKRYSGTVSAGSVRDFRGAMHGRSDKGIVITTGRFSREAVVESKRDGATPIELIDGDELCELMKELKLGVKVELVERVTVESGFFSSV